MPDHPPSPDPATYQAFLVRLWDPGAGGTRHVTVQRVGQDTERHFRSLVDLYAYLDRAALAVDAPGEARPGADEATDA